MDDSTLDDGMCRIVVHAPQGDDGDRAVIEVAGELDELGLGLLADARRSLPDHVGPVHLDLRQVTFVSLSAARFVIDGSNDGLPLVASSRAVTRTLALVGDALRAEGARSP